MRLENKNILLISPQPWDHMFVSKHYYALTLAKMGNYVYFLNPPGEKENITCIESSNLKVLNYKKFVTGIGKMPRFFRKLFMKTKMKRLERLAQARFDIVWSFDNSVFFDFDSFRSNSIKILHLVDLNQNFNLEIASKTADICFCTTQALKNRLVKLNNRTHIVNHGYALMGYQSMNRNDVGKIIVSYAGNLDIKYLDWPLIKSVIKYHPNVVFKFAGTCRNETLLTYLESTLNIQYVGVLSASELARFYEISDILILAYKAEEFPEQLANPHKIMEYLGAGKPIVATYTAEYVDYPNLIQMSQKNGDWPELFEEVLNNIEYYSSVDLSSARKKYATGNSYENQVKKIEYYLDQLL